MNTLKFLLCFSLAVFNTYFFSQKTCFQVCDTEKNGIPYVLLSDIQTDQTIVSDSLGRFCVIIQADKNYLIHFSGYKNKLVSGKEVIDLGKNCFTLEDAHTDLDEVIIVAADGNVGTEAISHIDARKISELNKFGGGHIIDKLNAVPGVYSVTTGPGIAKPLIRGFSGNRVVTLLNGQRLENQQWGGDHNIGITDLGIGQVEFVKGPASLMYGSDALGGVMYFSDEAFLPESKMSLNSKTVFESTNNLIQQQLGFRKTFKKLRVNSYLSYANAADMKLPDGTFINSSSYRDYVGKISLRYPLKKGSLSYFGNANISAFSVPGHTHDSIVTYATFISNEQERRIPTPNQRVQNYYNQIQFKWFNGPNSWQVFAGNTINIQREFEEKITVADLDLTLITSSLLARYSRKFSDNLELSLGSQNIYQTNTNDLDALGQLIPDYNQLDLGFFSYLKGKVKKLNYQLGARIDWRDLNSTISDRTFSGYTLATGIRYDFNKKNRLHLNLSSGFRAPNVSELFSYGQHHGASRFEIGTANLNSEYIQQVELSYEYSTEHLGIIFNPFFSKLNQFIYIQRLDTIIDNYPTYQYVQADRGQMYGMDVTVHGHFHRLDALHIQSTFSYLRNDLSSGTIMPFQPPARWGNQLLFNLNIGKKFTIDDLALTVDYYLAQNRIADFEVSTSDYALINLSLNTHFGKNDRFNWQFGLRNLLNQRVVPHLSRLRFYDIPINGANFTTNLQIRLFN